MKLKKLLSVVIALALLLTVISVPVFATTETPEILDFSKIPVNYHLDDSTEEQIEGYITATTPTMGMDDEGVSWSLDLDGITPEKQYYYDVPVYTVNAGETVEINASAFVSDSWGIFGGDVSYDDYDTCIKAYNDNDPIDDAWQFFNLEWDVGYDSESPVVTLFETNEDDKIKLYLTAEDAGNAVVIIHNSDNEEVYATPLLIKVVDNRVAKIGDVKYDTLEEAVAAANAGDTVTLINDVALTSSISLSKDLKLDLNGHTVTTNSVFFNIYSNYELTIKDSVGGGAVDAKDKVVYVSAGKFILEGGALSAHGSGSYTYGVQVGSSGSFEMNGGSITIPASSTSTYNYCVNNNGVAVINGGVLTAEASGGNYAVGNSGGTLTLAGGSVTAKAYPAGFKSPYALYIISGTAYVKGGYVKAIGDSATYSAGYLIDGSGNVSVTGGYFGGSCYYGISSSYVAEGYEVVTLTNNEANATDAAAKAAGYKFKAKAGPVAQIGSAKYETLEAAVAAAQSGDTVELLKDVDLSSHARGAADDIILNGVTLDLKGHTIYGFNNGVRYSGEGAVIKNGSFDFVDAELKKNYALSIGSYSNDYLTSSTVLLQDLTVNGGINVDCADVTLRDVDINAHENTYYCLWVDEDHSSATYESGTINGNSVQTAIFGAAKVKPADTTENVYNATLNVTGGNINTCGRTLVLASGVHIFVTGGVFDANVPAADIVAGYEAVALTGENEGKWQVGEVKASKIFEPDEPAENYDATYTIKKQVVDENDNPIEEGNGTERTINVKVITEETVSGNDNEQIMENLDMSKVLDSVVASVADADDTINVQIKVVCEETEIVNDTITYEVHPEAFIYLNNNAEPTETFVISNDALEENAVFKITLPVPAALAGNDYVKVIHRSTGYDDDVQLYPVKHENDNDFIELDVTHFSEFIVSANDLPLFAGYTVSLNGYIDLNFYLNLAADQVTNGTGTVVNFRWDRGEKYGIAEDSYQVQTTDLVDGKYKATVRISAAEMSDMITASVVINGSDAGSHQYSVRQYALQILNSPSSSDSVKYLVKTMLDYGAKAQVAFGRTDVVLANYGIDYTMGDVTENMIDTAISAANNGNHASDMASVAYDNLGAYSYTPSLIYLSGCTLRQYFISEWLDLENYVDTNNPLYKAYYLEKTDIAAAKLDTLQDFQIGEMTFKYSALDYVKAIICNYNVADPGYQLAAATYWYNQAANIYFGE